MRAGRIDGNQREVVEALRAAGMGVIVASRMGNGFPDLIVGCDGLNVLVEVKNPRTDYGRKGLNGNQKRFAETLGVEILIVHSGAEAVERVREYVRRKMGLDNRR